MGTYYMMPAITNATEVVANNAASLTGACEFASISGFPLGTALTGYNNSCYSPPCGCNFELPSYNEVLANFTVVVWLYLANTATTNFGGYTFCLFCTTTDDLNADQLTIAFSTFLSPPRVYVLLGNETQILSSTYNNAAWFQLAFAFTNANNNGSIYINGALATNVAGMSSAAWANSADSALHVGPTRADTANYFIGALAYLTWFPMNCLSANNISTIYNAMVPYF
jgi:hypothetical protein